MERHTAFPNAEEIRRLAEKQSEVVKQHVPHPCAYDDPECEVEYDAVDIFVRKIDIATSLRSIARKHPCGEEADNIHQAVPSDLDKPDFNGNGIDFGKRQHAYLTPHRNGLHTVRPAVQKTHPRANVLPL